MRFYPDKLEWVTCSRCGEPKLPHRICSTNMEICAMREEEFQNHVNKPMSNPTTSNAI